MAAVYHRFKILLPYYFWRFRKEYIYILFCLQKWNIFDITVHIELFWKRRGKMYATIWNTEFIFPKIREIEFHIYTITIFLFSFF